MPRASHKLDGLPNDLLTSDIENDRRLKVDADLQKSAYNEQLITSRVPITQIKAVYGIRSDTFSASLGGTTTTVDSKFSLTSGVTSTGIASISTDQQASYRSGQGLGCMVSAIFGAEKANNTQIAGFISSDSLIGFGYNGTEFGIVFGRNGALEIQDLTISTPAAVAENATVTVNGQVLVIPITAGTTSHNAWEITKYIAENYQLYETSSNSNVVTVMGNLPEIGGGSFAFSSATAAGTWSLKQANTIATETWTPKAEWNINPDIDTNPHLGNIYMVQFQYLGFGDFFFSIQNPLTSKFELVHINKYTNTSIVPNVDNPVFRSGWAVRNTGNTTDVTLQGASAELFNEGIVTYDTPLLGATSEILADNNNFRNVLAFRNKLTFENKTNRINVLPGIISISTESTKIAKINIYEDPVFDADPVWVDAFTGESLIEVSKIANQLVSGKLIASFSATKETPFYASFDKLIEIVKPQQNYSISVELSSGADALVEASITWREDF